MDRERMPMTEGGHRCGCYLIHGGARRAARQRRLGGTDSLGKPFVRWDWFGGAFMALGGVLAMLDKRYRFDVVTRRPSA